MKKRIGAASALHRFKMGQEDLRGERLDQMMLFHQQTPAAALANIAWGKASNQMFGDRSPYALSEWDASRLGATLRQFC